MNEIIFNTGDKVCLIDGTREYYHKIIYRIHKLGYGISIELYDRHGNVIGYETTRDGYDLEVIKTQNIPGAIGIVKGYMLVRFEDCEGEDVSLEKLKRFIDSQ